MIKYISKATVLLAFFLVSCDNAKDLLDNHIKNGPIVYAGKINELTTQSGNHRLRVNIFPAEDVNRSHCILSWNITNDVKDSIKVDYVASNFDSDLKCYYKVIDFTAIEGNLLISAQNVDTFGNRSLKTNKGAYIYGPVYVSTLTNAGVKFSTNKTEITFESKVSSVGNLVSYQLNSGQFTPETLVTGSYKLVDAKKGGIIRSKTKYLVTETDIDYLFRPNYLETIIL